MDVDKPKVYGDTSITDGLVFFPFQLLEDKYLTSIRARLLVAMLGVE